MSDATERVSIAIVGAGAAGLMAAIHAARTDPQAQVVLLDGARRVGAKILVAGGGRCNVTHWRVRPEDYAGSTRPAIRKVLGRYPVEAVAGFFEELGVQLKREETGKLFPVSDRAQSVLQALLDAGRDAGVDLRFPRRVHRIDHTPDGRFRIAGDRVALLADRVILSTGGKALPKTGSDGGGYQLARHLGHTITDQVHPALVPLRLREGDPLCAIKGIATPARLRVTNERGRTVAEYTAPLLCTHFGVSGPVVLDASRHLLALEEAGHPGMAWVNWLPEVDRSSFESDMLGAAGDATIGSTLRGLLPERLVGTLSRLAGLEPSDHVRSLRKDARRRLLESIFAHPLEVVGDRGYTFAEATAGGVPLSEVKLDSMESRRVPGLHLAGEILDVDGRVGGFNFQWAWASGYVAGTAAATLGYDGVAVAGR